MNKSKTWVTFSIIVFMCLSALANIVFVVMLINTDKIKSENIYNNAILKTVEIKMSDDGETWGYATGAFISSNGKIITNKHVVKNEQTQNLRTHVLVRMANENEYHNAEIIKVSQQYDLAIIKIDKENTPYFNFASSVENGETIYTIGNPNGFGLSFSSGVVSSNLRNVIFNGNTIQAMQTSFVINEGNSGGPVINKYGNLVGIISFRLKDSNSQVIQGVSFAIPITFIKEFFES